MTNEEAIHKLEYSKKAYQTLIDEKVDSGKLVGDGVRGEWKAETPLDEAYKSMIEALDMAIKALEQQPCEDCISRQEALSNKHIVYDDDGIGYHVVRVDEIMTLSSVTPKPKTGKWERFADDYKRCSECEAIVMSYHNYKYCPNCGAKMEGEDDRD